MKNMFIALAAVAAALFAVPAAVAETYVGVGIAQNQTEVEGFDLADGTALDVTVGTGVAVAGQNFRVEGSVARLTSDTDILGLNLNVEAVEVSAAALYDIPVPADWSVRPYAGFGVNYTQGEADLFFTSFDVSGPGYDVRAGVRTQLTDRITADLGVRFGRKDLELEAFGTTIDIDEEETRLRAGFSVAL